MFAMRPSPSATPTEATDFRTARWSAILLGFSIPVSVALDNVLLLVFLLAWLLGGGWREKLAIIRQHPVTPAVLGLFGLVLLGCLYGPQDSADMLRFLRKYASLLLILLLLPLFRDPRDQLRAMIAFGAAMGLTLLLSFLLWWGVLPETVKTHHLAENPTVFKLHITQSLFMALACFLAIVGALHVRQYRWRLLLAVAALLTAFNALFMIEGRTGQLVLACLLGYLFIDRLGWRGVLLALIGCGLVLILAYLVQAPVFERFALAANEYQQWASGTTGANKTSIGLRMDYYLTSMQIFREHPFFGVGTGGFTSAYGAIAAANGQVGSNNPHQYLLIAAQYGLVGLCLLLLLFYMIWRSAAALTKSRQLIVRGLLLAMLIGNLFNSFLLDHAESLLFVWLTGILLAGHGNSTRPADAAPNNTAT
ncbi:MAG: O-antigen ligase family protein [Sterolibacterium sp.]|nr:O-antigen ligase family protein [Sterolibacterium sp.]